MSLQLKIVSFLLCIVGILFITLIIMKLRWIILNIELILSYTKEYVFSILAVKEQDFKKYREKLAQETKLSCMLFLANDNIDQLEEAYKEFEKEKIEEFKNKLDTKLEEINFEQCSSKVDEEYSKIMKTPLLKIYFKTIFGKVKSFDEFINREYLETLKEKTEENRRKVSD